MKFKTDENVHPDLAVRMRADGHDAETVWDEGLRGGADARIAERCAHERRVLVTFDRGFGDVRTYPPSEFPGIIVLRLRRQSRESVLATWPRIAALLAGEQIVGALWIVDEDHVRVRTVGGRVT